MLTRTLSLFVSLLAFIAFAVAQAAEPAPPSPRPAPNPPPAAAPAPAPAAPLPASNSAPEQLSPRIDAWFQGTLLSVDPQHSTFTVHGGNMPYATTYAKMLREMNDKTAKITDPEQRRRAETDIRNGWRDRLNQARAQRPEPMGSDMHFQLPARGAVMMLNETDSTGLGFLNYDRGLEEAASNVGVGGPEPIRSLRDFHPGERVMVGYASDSPDRNMPEAYAIVRERPGVAPMSGQPIYPPTTMEAQPLPPSETQTTTVYEEERTERSPISNAGHTMKSGLENGANKIKHFFGGD